MSGVSRRILRSAVPCVGAWKEAREIRDRCEIGMDSRLSLLVFFFSFFFSCYFLSVLCCSCFWWCCCPSAVPRQPSFCTRRVKCTKVAEQVRNPRDGLRLLARAGELQSSTSVLRCRRVSRSKFAAKKLKWCLLGDSTLRVRDRRPRQACKKWSI